MTIVNGWADGRVLRAASLAGALALRVRFGCAWRPRAFGSAVPDLALGTAAEEGGAALCGADKRDNVAGAGGPMHFPRPEPEVLFIHGPGAGGMSHSSVVRRPRDLQNVANLPKRPHLGHVSRWGMPMCTRSARGVKLVTFFSQLVVISGVGIRGRAARTVVLQAAQRAAQGRRGCPPGRPRPPQAAHRAAQGATGPPKATPIRPASPETARRTARPAVIAGSGRA